MIFLRFLALIFYFFIAHKLNNLFLESNMVPTQTILLPDGEMPTPVKLNITVQRGIPTIKGVGVRLKNSLETYRLLQNWLSLFGVKFKYYKIIIIPESLEPFDTLPKTLDTSQLSIAIGVWLLQNKYSQKAGWFKKQNPATVWVGTISYNIPEFSIENEKLPYVLAVAQILSQFHNKEILVAHGYKKINRIAPLPSVNSPLRGLYITNIFNLHNLAEKITTKNKLKFPIFAKTFPLLQWLSSKIKPNLLPEVFSLKLQKYVCFPILLTNLEPRKNFFKLYNILQHTLNWKIFITPCKCGNLLSNQINCTCNVLQRNEALSRIIALCNISKQTYLYLPTNQKTLKTKACTEVQKILTL